MSTIIHEATISFRLVDDGQGGRLECHIASDEITPDMSPEGTMSMATAVAVKVLQDFTSGELIQRTARDYNIEVNDLRMLPIEDMRDGQ